MQQRLLAAALCGVACVVGSIALTADSNSDVLITSAVTTFKAAPDTSTLLIQGTNLRSRDARSPIPSVFLFGPDGLPHALAVLDATDTAIRAQLSTTPPGTWRLFVHRDGHNHRDDDGDDDRDVINVTFGAPGPAGATGPAGVQGVTGPPGPAGAAGVVGATGPTGPAGSAGPAGPNGATGVNGAAGSVGAAGPQGSTGAAGATGPQGPAGPVGPQGPQGPAGDAGPVGPVGPDFP